ncbi:MAG: TonB family protein [Chitinophagaceae bacterium]|nr:TonB family protein [Chitinophagaceae bacterium]
METNKILKADILDILFDQRNKAYGAYELRKNYHKRVRRSITIVVTLSLIIASAQLIAGLVGEKAIRPNPHRYDTVVLKHIDDVVKPPKPTVHPPKVREVPPVKTAKVTPPTIVPATTVNPNEELKPLPKDAVAGTETQAGKIPGPGDIAPPHVPPGTTPGIVEVPGPKTVIPVDAVSVDQMPEFPGGEDELLAYLGSHIKYPSSAVTHETQGKVVLEFVINTEGEIAELKVKRGIGYGCDEEALRVVAGMPKWKPGRNNGIAVPVLFSLPIFFRLDDQ